MASTSLTTALVPDLLWCLCMGLPATIGLLSNEARIALTAVLRATADGSLFDVDTALAEQILLPNDEDLDNPHTEEKDRHPSSLRPPSW